MTVGERRAALPRRHFETGSSQTGTKANLSGISRNQDREPPSAVVPAKRRTIMDDRTKRNIFITGAVVGAAAALTGVVLLSRKIAKMKQLETHQFSAADALCSLDEDEAAGEEVWVNIPEQGGKDDTADTAAVSGDKGETELSPTTADTAVTADKTADGDEDQ